MRREAPMVTPMQNPRNLKVRSEARALARETYRLTATFPHHEQFGLTSQMRRAAVSVGSNVAEGCGRQGDRAMIAYLHQSIGSLNELEFQLEVAEDLDYCDEEGIAVLRGCLITTRKMTAALIVTLRKRASQDSTFRGPHSSS